MLCNIYPRNSSEWNQSVKANGSNGTDNEDRSETSSKVVHTNNRASALDVEGPKTAQVGKDENSSNQKRKQCPSESLSLLDI